MASCCFLVVHSSGFLRAATDSSAGRNGDSVSSNSLTRTAVSAVTSPSCNEPLKLRGVRRRTESPFWGLFGADRSNSSQRVFCPCLRAKRNFRGGGGDVTRGEPEEELDVDLRVGLNEISTEALKAMLSEDDKVVATLREKVEYIGEYLSQQEQPDAARFMLVVMGMLDHEVIAEKDDLTGAYQKGIEKIFSVIEDSGWVLKQAGADVGGVEMVDDEVMPPVLNTQY